MPDKKLPVPQIILIGNYPPDKQESMERFAQMLHQGFQKAGYSTIIWRPKAFFASRAKSTVQGFGKWLGYLDKWILFPLILRWRFLFGNYKANNTRVHICDHSNAMYLNHVPSEHAGITCHDVLAIRGAFGFADAYCPASSFGKILQQWILGNLVTAKRLACVSQFTLNQLIGLADTLHPRAAKTGWQVIHNAFNAPFNRIDSERALDVVRSLGYDADMPFLLHVGSNLERKNRRILLDIVKHLGDGWRGNICFAGQALTNDFLDHAASLGLRDRVYSIVKPNHEGLVALYNTCDAFIFPSFSEGFGWPVIEAQACGAPVVASNIAPMPEIGGSGALYADPYRPEEFAGQLTSLASPETRAAIINSGYENIKRFEPDLMMDAYLAMYGLKRLTV